MKLFWKIYSSIFISFLIIVSATSYIIAVKQVAEAEKTLLNEEKTLTGLIFKEVEVGYYESTWPLESLKEFSKHSNCFFWWIVRDDGIIYLADSVSFMGTYAQDYFPHMSSMAGEDNIYLDRRQGYGIILKTFGPGKQKWSFWHGFSMKKVTERKKEIILLITTVGLSALITLGIILFFTIEYLLARPFSALAMAAIKIGNGDFTQKVKICSEDELGQLARIFNNMVEALERNESHRKLAEDTLKQSEAKYRELVENANSIIYKRDTSGNIIFFNEFAQKFFGYSEEEMIGKNVVGTILPMDDPSGHPYGDIIQDINIHPEKYAYHEKECIRKNGDKVWVVWTNKIISDKNGDADGVLCIGTDINERKRAELELKASEERFRLLVEKAPDGIFVQTNGQFAYVNMVAMQMFGATSSYQMCGQPIMTRFHPDFHAAIRERIRLINEEKGEAPLMEQKYLKLDGTPFDVEVSAVPFTYENQKGALVFFRDITIRKQVEQAFLAEKYFSESILDSMPSIFYCFDDQLQFKRWNHNFERVSGYSAQEISAMSPLDFFTGEGEQLIEEKVREVFTKGKSSVEADFVSKDGRKIPYFLTGLKAMVDNVTHLIGVGIDISSRKQAEEALKKSELMFRSMSFTDELTAMYNRRGFITLSEQQLKIAERTKKNMLLFFADLDKMKQINDTMGYREGDKALIEIATILKEVFRESDIIGRMGGDEFAILAIDTTDETREVLMKRLYIILETYNRLEGRNYQLSLSIGIAHYDPEKPSSLDKLMAQADILMYEEKRNKQG